jgi:hypothetical protein
LFANEFEKTSAIVVTTDNHLRRLANNVIVDGGVLSDVNDDVVRGIAISEDIAFALIATAAHALTCMVFTFAALCSDT